VALVSGDAQQTLAAELATMSVSRSRILLTLIAGFALGIGVTLSQGAPAARQGTSSDDVLPWRDAQVLAEVLERVRQDYVDPIDDHQLMQNAIRGMVAGLDPHSAYLDDQQYDEMRITTSGNYSGVGIEVSIEDGAVTVIAPIEDTPAARAGILPGDIISSIDGIAVEQSDLNDAVARMRGAPGTKVKVGITRTGSEQPLSFELTRASVQVHSVRQEMLEPGYAYVRITQFSETTGADLRTALATLRTAAHGHFKGLVLDLRNNPGGVLEAAVTVSDAFLEDGIIVTASGRTPESRFEMDATPGDMIEGAPIVVLVNAGSASASEIVAGALKDHDRATLIGQTTFGKGSVQTVMPLSDGRAIKLTTSRYFTPSGASIQSKGITPDVVLKKEAVTMPEAGDKRPLLVRDSEVRAALEALKAEPPQRGKQVAQASR
jgi:carboxyl-terminal processing protease